MLLDVLIISLVIAFLRGGKLGNLAKINFNNIALIIIPFIIQYVLVVGGERGVDFFARWGAYLHIISYSILLTGIWYNRHIEGIGIFGAGIMLNFLVILANKGQMPVSLLALERVGMQDMLPLLERQSYVIHSIMSPESKLKFLADVIPLPPPYPKPRVLSIGDLIMAVGAFLFVQNYMVRKIYLFKIFSRRRKSDGDRVTIGKDEKNRRI